MNKRTPLLLSFAAWLAAATPAIAQDAVLPDPTVESPAMVSQLEAVRGVEQLDALTRRLDLLAQQNASLMDELARSNQRIADLEGLLKEANDPQQLSSVRRQALPQLRLVSQLRTATLQTAELEEGDRIYRISEGRQFRLFLADGLSLTATPRFVDDGTVEISLQELDTTLLLAFRPSVARSK